MEKEQQTIPELEEAIELVKKATKLNDIAGESIDSTQVIKKFLPKKTITGREGFAFPIVSFPRIDIEYENEDGAIFIIPKDIPFVYFRETKYGEYDQIYHISIFQNGVETVILNVTKDTWYEYVNTEYPLPYFERRKYLTNCAEQEIYMETYKFTYDECMNIINKICITIDRKYVLDTIQKKKSEAKKVKNKSNKAREKEAKKYFANYLLLKSTLGK